MSFILAHFSDPHLSTPSLASWRFMLNKRLLGYLSWYGQRRHEYPRAVLEALVTDWRAQPVDHTVITGDLTQLGLPDEYSQVQAWLTALDTPERVTVIPGNHDAYATASWQETLTDWLPYMRSDTDRCLFPIVRYRGCIQIIGISTACPSPPLLATGRVGVPQAQQLAAVLAHSAGCFRVVLIHHPPIPGRWHKRLLDRDVIGHVLQTQGAELVLHGHWHCTAFHQLPGPQGMIPIIGVPAASSRGKRAPAAAYHLYHIEKKADGWILRVQRRGYSAALNRFVALDEWAVD